MARQLGIPVIIFDEMSLEESKNVIGRERVDVLLFLAVPTEKLTFSLSSFKLAPIQIQFGRFLIDTKLILKWECRQESVIR